MKRLRFMKLAWACIILATVCGHAADVSTALKVTDLAKLGEFPFNIESTLGTKVRVYRDLAYSTRDDLPTEGEGYVSRSKWGGRHRSGTSLLQE